MSASDAAEPHGWHAFRARVLPFTRRAAKPVLLLLVLALVYAAVGLRGRGPLRHAPGPVAAVHATWEAQCDACHVPWTSLTGKSQTAAILGKSPGDSGLC